jgi:hypothetical protein
VRRENVIPLDSALRRALSLISPTKKKEQKHGLEQGSRGFKSVKRGLTHQQYLDIRGAYEFLGKSKEKLALEYGMTPRAIARILEYVTRVHVIPKEKDYRVGQKPNHR